MPDPVPKSKALSTPWRTGLFASALQLVGFTLTMPQEVVAAVAGAQRLNDLLDVSIGDGTLDQRNVGQPRVALQDDQLLKYNTADGTWRNTSIINCGDVLDVN